MSLTTPAVSGLVRVTVSAGERKLDLALPATISVAELLPELARSLGMLDPHTVHAGYSLHAADGTRLQGATGLAFQNVRDGALLTLTSGIDEKSSRVYDDVVEAMADVVEDEMRPWAPESARRTALGAAMILLGLGALAIELQRPSAVAGALAGIIAAILVASALVVDRVQDEDEVAAMLAWAAVIYAFVCGLTAVTADQVLAEPMAAAGGGAAIAGALSAFFLRTHRTLLLPAVFVGVLVAAASSIVAASSLDAADVYTVALAIAVLAASALPALSMSAGGNRIAEPDSPLESTAEPEPVEASRIRGGALIGHHVLLAVTVTTGLLVVAISPFAVSLGVCGALMAALGSIVVMLRTRQYRVGSEVAVGLTMGLAGLFSVAISVLVEQPSWRPTLAIILAAIAAITLVLTLVPSTPSVTRGRTAELAELVALVAMLPLLVVAIGLVEAVRS